jgi:hypothetical protein
LMITSQRKTVGKGSRKAKTKIKSDPLTSVLTS